VTKPTDKPFLAGRQPQIQEQYGSSPVPLLPTAITSLLWRATYSQRASSSTIVLFERRDRRKLETVQALHRREPRLLDAAASTIRCSRSIQFELGQAAADNEGWSTSLPAAHCWASLSYSRKKLRQLECLQVIGRASSWGGVAHDEGRR